MKIILSRKGFDSAYGGYPSPILPDGRMISLPIPSESERIAYSDLKLNFENYETYYHLMKDLIPKIKINGRYQELTPSTRCHLDPDIYPNLLNRPAQWKPLFGQIGNAQSHLEHQKVKIGDIFFFFGTFQRTEYRNGRLKFVASHLDKPKHIIFGYLQIGEIIKINSEAKVPSWMGYHPHLDEKRKKSKNNTIYIAKDTLTFDSDFLGAGTFNFHHSLVLTKKGFSKSCWALPSFFKKVRISYHSPKNWKRDCFQSVGRGQEFVIQCNTTVERWARELILTTITNSDQ